MCFFSWHKLGDFPLWDLFRVLLACIRLFFPVFLTSNWKLLFTVFLLFVRAEFCFLLCRREIKLHLILLLNNLLPRLLHMLLLMIRCCVFCEILSHMYSTFHLASFYFFIWVICISFFMWFYPPSTQRIYKELFQSFRFSGIRTKISLTVQASFLTLWKGCQNQIIIDMIFHTPDFGLFFRCYLVAWLYRLRRLYLLYL